MSINICAKKKCDRCLLVAKCYDLMSINLGSIDTINIFRIIRTDGQSPTSVRKKKERQNLSLYIE